MKKTQLIDIFKGIKKSSVTFISIVMFIVLGAAIFLGVTFAMEALRKATDDVFQKGNMEDAEAYYPYGVNDEDLQKILALDDVDEVEGQFFAYEFFDWGDESRQAKLISLTETINTPYSIKGELPQKDNEIAIEEGSSRNLGIGIGDQVTFYGGDAKTVFLMNHMSEIEELDEVSHLHIKKYFQYLLLKGRSSVYVYNILKDIRSF